MEAALGTALSGLKDAAVASDPYIGRVVRAVGIGRESDRMAVRVDALADPSRVVLDVARILFRAGYGHVIRRIEGENVVGRGAGDGPFKERKIPIVGLDRIAGHIDRVRIRRIHGERDIVVTLAAEE